MHILHRLKRISQAIIIGLSLSPGMRTCRYFSGQHHIYDYHGMDHQIRRTG